MDGLKGVAKVGGIGGELLQEVLEGFRVLLLKRKDQWPKVQQGL